MNRGTASSLPYRPYCLGNLVNIAFLDDGRTKFIISAAGKLECRNADRSVPWNNVFIFNGPCRSFQLKLKLRLPILPDESIHRQRSRFGFSVSFVQALATNPVVFPGARPQIFWIDMNDYRGISERLDAGKRHGDNEYCLALRGCLVMPGQ